MASMNEFLRFVSGSEFKAGIDGAEDTWNRRAAALNRRLADDGLPVRVRNLSSIWTVIYENASRYNWLLQYYLRAEGLSLSWIGTGRFIFSHNYTQADFDEVADRIVRACRQMRDDAWWRQPSGASNKAIRKAVFREILANRF